MNPFNGNYLWVLRAANCGGPEKLVEVAAGLGYGVIVKYHDGDPADDTKWGWVDDFRKIVKAAKPRGVPVLAWGYCYGNAYGNLFKEVDGALASLDDGALGYVIDAESEWETLGSDKWARDFMSAVKKYKPGAALAYSTFWNLRWHPMFPAQAFVDNGCVAAIPQTYFGLGQKWSPAAQAEMLKIARQDFGGLPVYPAGEMTSDVSAGNVLDFINLAQGPHSLWLLDRVPKDRLDILSRDQSQAAEMLAKIREILR